MSGLRLPESKIHREHSASESVKLHKLHNENVDNLNQYKLDKLTAKNELLNSNVKLPEDTTTDFQHQRTIALPELRVNSGFVLTPNRLNRTPSPLENIRCKTVNGYLSSSPSNYDNKPLSNSYSLNITNFKPVIGNNPKFIEINPSNDIDNTLQSPKEHLLHPTNSITPSNSGHRVMLSDDHNEDDDIAYILNHKPSRPSVTEGTMHTLNTLPTLMAASTTCTVSHRTKSKRDFPNFESLHHSRDGSEVVPSARSTRTDLTSNIEALHFAAAALCGNSVDLAHTQPPPALLPKGTDFLNPLSVTITYQGDRVVQPLQLNPPTQNEKSSNNRAMGTVIINENIEMKCQEDDDDNIKENHLTIKHNRNQSRDNMTTLKAKNNNIKFGTVKNENLRKKWIDDNLWMDEKIQENYKWNVGVIIKVKHNNERDNNWTKYIREELGFSYNEDNNNKSTNNSEDDTDIIMEDNGRVKPPSIDDSDDEDDNDDSKKNSTSNSSSRIPRDSKQSFTNTFTDSNGFKATHIYTYGPYRSTYGYIIDECLCNHNSVVLIATGAGVSYILDFLMYTRANRIKSFESRVDIHFSCRSIKLFQWITDLICGPHIKKQDNLYINAHLTSHDNINGYKYSDDTNGNDNHNHDGKDNKKSIKSGHAKIGRASFETVLRNSIVNTKVFFCGNPIIQNQLIKLCDELHFKLYKSHSF